MNFIITILILIFILGILVFIHELGHFLAAKKNNIYIYDFSIGMGPKLFEFKRKDDETKYTIRLFPIGGFVAMANDNENTPKNIKKDRIFENLKYKNKMFILFAGILMNFLLAIILLFVNGIIFGSPETKPIVGSVKEGYPAYNAGLEENDLILEVDSKEVNSFESIMLILTEKNIKTDYKFKIKKENGNIVETNIFPKKIKTGKTTSYVFGITASTKKYYGPIPALKYTGEKFVNISETIFKILGKIFSGKIGVDKLSGPVGMYGAVDQIKQSGVEGIIYLIAFLSVNIAFINLVPIPVFDGGRILIESLEKIKGRKISPKIFEYLNLLGFLFLILLIVLVTISDICKLF